MESSTPNSQPKRRRPNGARGQGGQILIEYLLLTLVTVGIASLFVRLLVSRSPDNAGALLRRWDAVNTQIGKDDPEKR